MSATSQASTTSRCSAVVAAVAAVDVSFLSADLLRDTARIALVDGSMLHQSITHLSRLLLLLQVCCTAWLAPCLMVLCMSATSQASTTSRC
jgi:hypothetical protein